MINQEKLDKQIIIQKKIIASLFHHHNDIKDFKEVAEILSNLRRKSEISLVVANFKCQRCGNEQTLQYHHLVPRKAKEYMDKIRYISSRYYYGNIIILCKECHYKYHTENKLPIEIAEEGIIQQKTIDRIKNKYIS